jgi:hypothetical protein
MELADLVDLVNGKFHSISTGKMWKWNGMEWNGMEIFHRGKHL